MINKKILNDFRSFFFLSLHVWSLWRCLTAASSSTFGTRTSIAATVGWWCAAWTGAWASPWNRSTLTTRWWTLQWQPGFCWRTEFCTSPTLPMSISVSHKHTLRRREGGQPTITHTQTHAHSEEVWRRTNYHTHTRTHTLREENQPAGTFWSN